MEFCSITPPYKLDGESLLKHMISKKTNKKNIAYSYWKEGISIRTEKYRLTKFFRKEEPRIELLQVTYDSEGEQEYCSFKQD